MADPTDVANKAKRIKEIEHETDESTHACVERLHKTFITPFDRDDINRLITRMDDIMDFVEAATEHRHRARHSGVHHAHHHRRHHRRRIDNQVVGHQVGRRRADRVGLVPHDSRLRPRRGGVFQATPSVASGILTTGYYMTRLPQCDRQTCELCPPLKWRPVCYVKVTCRKRPRPCPMNGAIIRAFR